MANTSNVQAWYENDAFWSTMAPLMFSPRRLEGTPAEVDQIIALLNIQPGARVLDLACGPGRHSLEFARRGYRVTGVDRTTLYLKQAREQAAREGLDVEFVQCDMREFVRAGAFDAAINMFSAFGYFDDPADDRRVAQNVCEALGPGGAFLIQTMGKEVLARIFQERRWSEEDGVIWLEEGKILDNWARSETRWILFKDAERHEFRFTLRLYAATEMMALLQDCGFASTRIFGDLVGAPYDQDAKRLHAVARKAA